MKQTIILTLFILCSCTFAYAQKQSDSVYVAQNGTVFKVGQNITLGLGSAADGKFKYILGMVLGLPNPTDNLPPEYAAQSVTLYKIKKTNKLLSKINTVYLIFKVRGNIESYCINIEPALLAKEVSLK